MDRFLEPIKWGSLGLFKLRFLESFKASFSYLLQIFSPLVLEQILPFKRRVYQEGFKNDSLSFSPQIPSLFSHTYLSFLLLYHSYRRGVVRLFLGDQSVVITKVFYFVFEEEDLRVCVVSSSSESSVQRCGLGKLACLRVFVLTGIREGLESPKEFQCELLVGVAAPSDPVGSLYSENPSQC